MLGVRLYLSVNFHKADDYDDDNCFKVRNRIHLLVCFTAFHFLTPSLLLSENGHAVPWSREHRVLDWYADSNSTMFDCLNAILWQYIQYSFMHQWLSYKSINKHDNPYYLLLILFNWMIKRSKRPSLTFVRWTIPWNRLLLSFIFLIFSVFC